MRIGIFQCAAGGLGLEARLQRLQQALAADADAGTRLDLVLCPELFASGYNVGDTLIAAAETASGPIRAKVADLARQYDTAIVYGYPEQDDGKIYNSAAFVTSAGDLLANHRKGINAPGDFESRYFTPGARTTQVSYRDINIAILICYEIEFPENARHAALQGAHLLLVPTALGAQWGVVAECVIPSRAFENGVWLAYANHAGHENGIDYLGGSRIVAPDGSIEAVAGADETLISCSIDSTRVEAAQRRLPYLRDRDHLSLVKP